MAIFKIALQAMNAFTILAFAIRRWWDEYISVILLSAAWLLAQVLVIPGPPATAALYAMTRETYDGRYWGAADAWAAWRAYFWPAWKWGALNLMVAGVGLYNVSTFWYVPGVWQGLRVVWLVALAVWLALNVYYWPFWLAAADKSLRNTYANVARFWLLQPGTALLLWLITLLGLVVGLSTVVPVVLGLPCLLALIGETAVRRSLNEFTTD
jgi:hypothetical protein